MCSKAGEACNICAQGEKIQPDHIYKAPTWTWEGKTFKTVMREN